MEKVENKPVNGGIHNIPSGGECYEKIKSAGDGELGRSGRASVKMAFGQRCEGNVRRL